MRLRDRSDGRQGTRQMRRSAVWSHSNWTMQQTTLRVAADRHRRWAVEFVWAKNMSDLKRDWLCACLFFTASASSLVAVATSRDPFHLKLITGLATWVLGFISLIRLKPSVAVQLDDAAGEVPPRS
mgnify:CR=1 FL=1